MIRVGILEELKEVFLSCL